MEFSKITVILIYIWLILNNDIVLNVWDCRWCLSFSSFQVTRLSRKNVCFVMFMDEVTLQTLSSEGHVSDRMGFIGLWKVVLVKNLPYSDMRRVGKIPKLLPHRLFPSARWAWDYLHYGSVCYNAVHGKMLSIACNWTNVFLFNLHWLIYVDSVCTYHGWQMIVMIITVIYCGD